MPSAHLTREIILDARRLIAAGWHNGVIAGVLRQRYHVAVRARCIEKIRTCRKCSARCQQECK